MHCWHVCYRSHKHNTAECYQASLKVAVHSFNKHTQPEGGSTDRTAKHPNSLSVFLQHGCRPPVFMLFSLRCTSNKSKWKKNPALVHFMWRHADENFKEMFKKLIMERERLCEIFSIQLQNVKKYTNAHTLSRITCYCETCMFAGVVV